MNQNEGTEFFIACFAGINEFYLLHFSNEKKTNTILISGSSTNILLSLSWARPCERGSFMHILTFRNSNNDRILLAKPPLTKNVHVLASAKYFTQITSVKVFKIHPCFSICHPFLY